MIVEQEKKWMALGLCNSAFTFPITLLHAPGNIFYSRLHESTINTSEDHVGSLVGGYRPFSLVKMKSYVLVLVLVIFVADVRPIFEEVSDIVFKKYATMKIMEDCYGKETVNNMLSEVALAYARCRGKPSFLPMLEQLGTFNVEQVSEEPQVTETDPTTTPATTTTTPSTTTISITDSPVKQVPLAVFRPSAVKIPQQIFNQYPPRFGYDNRRFWASYYSPNQGAQFQQRFPYGDDSYYYGTSMNPGGYRWKRAEHRTLPEGNQETVEKLPMAAESSQPAAPFAFPFANKLFSKQETILGNVTCVMKEIGFIGEDMQLNFNNIRKRIDDLSVTAELKADLIDGIETCKQFTSCIPAEKFGDIPILKDMVAPYAFFKCFKGRKIEACMKKDLKEKFLALLTGAPSNRAKQMRSETESEVQENMDSIFNVVYGFGSNTPSTGFL